MIKKVLKSPFPTELLFKNSVGRLFSTESAKIGTAPGSLIFVGMKRTENVRLDAWIYNKENLEQYKDISPVNALDYVRPNSITWFNLYGLHNTEVVGILGGLFEIEPLLQEDILNTNQRPKFDSDEKNLAIFLKMLRLNEKSKVVESEQISIIFAKSYLICFQEAEGDVFNGVRDRMAVHHSKARQRTTDYLAFALLDAIVDNYVLSIEYFGGQIESIVDALIKTENKKLLHKVNSYRREINFLRRTVRPVLEITNLFEKSESPIVNKKTIPYIKDLEDHTLHTIEGIETYKELLNDELGIFHMTMGSKLNDILKVLTIFSVIFIPLTFIAGIYGTNFDYVPELHYRYAYPIFWSTLLTIAALMLIIFKRKGWL